MTTLRELSAPGALDLRSSPQAAGAHLAAQQRSAFGRIGSVMPRVACAERAGRPRLALVLGSGGVRSAAAIGAVEVLASEGLRPDLIVGCSSGALFGAGLALGKSQDETLRMAIGMWSADLTEQRRWRALPQMLVPRLTGFDPATFSMRDDRRIRRTLENAFGGMRLEELQIPLRVAATDATTGAPVVLSVGSVVTALRASLAVPFMFPSVAVNGRQLVDGVISDPLPVAAAADADAVVAIGFEAPMPRRIDRASRLLAQASTAMINNLQQARIEAARHIGLRAHFMQVRFARPIGLWETAAIPQACEAGRHSARRELPQIRQLLASFASREA